MRRSLDHEEVLVHHGLLRHRTVHPIAHYLPALMAWSVTTSSIDVFNISQVYLSSIPSKSHIHKQYGEHSMNLM